MSILTRFAPSPTGLLHLGHAFSAWNAWRRADVFLLRLEDIDTTRCRPEFSEAILEDLQWLGLDWDGEVRVQSEHFPEYQTALDSLRDRGLLYPCFCTRSEIARAQAAPHEGEVVYPGTCRKISEAERADRIAAGEPFALRLAMDAAMAQAGAPKFFEEGAGWINATPERFGDVVLARRDIPTSYHLCVAHDDATQKITHVIRGEDLREATHIHVLLQALLGIATPVYAHHALLRDAAGKRLAKRDNALSLRSLRLSGVAAGDVLKRFEGGQTA
ncbi:MAG TPA: tRNA glutamyl-Q(34) synthetase GluQRS [Acidocella sp.]|nr:tRNA glutamyl-Q(34) synthetase GluQRS [Acidocella sp.]